MKFLKLSLFVFPLLMSQPLLALDSIDNNENEDITNPGTGTFQLNERYSRPSPEKQQRMQDAKQLEMEREEADLDGFGQDEYNENVDPDDYKVDEDIK